MSSILMGGSNPDRPAFQDVVKDLGKIYTIKIHIDKRKREMRVASQCSPLISSTLFLEYIYGSCFSEYYGSLSRKGSVPSE